VNSIEQKTRVFVKLMSKNSISGTLKSLPKAHGGI
jgi:hypothetical protein